MVRHLAWFGVTVLTLTVRLVPASAQEPEVVYPPLAGTTVIHADGIAGITLSLPADVRIFESSMSLSPSPGTRFAQVRIAEDFANEFCDFCVANSASHTDFGGPAQGREPTYNSCYGEQGEDVGCEHEAGLMELYFTSVGPATLTLRLPELAGTAEYTATGHVDGIAKSIAVRGCDEFQCESSFWGGEAFQIGLGGRPALAEVVAYVSIPRGDPQTEVSPGVIELRACAYPGIFGGANADPDPAAHPNGCDGNFVPRGIVGNGGGLQAPDGFARSHGLQYLGFRIYQRGVLYPPDQYGAWGVWLNRGMECPSRDFSDCDKPVED